MSKKNEGHGSRFGECVVGRKIDSVEAAEKALEEGHLMFAIIDESPDGKTDTIDLINAKLHNGEHGNTLAFLRMNGLYQSVTNIAPVDREGKALDLEEDEDSDSESKSKSKSKPKKVEKTEKSEDKTPEPAAAE